MHEHLLYIAGAWRGGGAGAADAVSPASGETFATVAVADPAGACVAALSISGPEFRMRPEALDALGLLCSSA